MAKGEFREDLYYRLCADVIRTPPLAEQLRETPGELRNMVRHLARRLLEDEEAEKLTAEVVAWIDERLGRDYPWPGNVRELDQCIRNVLVRREYVPVRRERGPGEDAFLEAVQRGELTVGQLMGQYVTRVYARTGSYQAAARQLDVDHRTIKSRIDADLLHRLRGDCSPSGGPRAAGKQGS